MHTLIVVVAGLALLAVLLWFARVSGKAIVFLGFFLWLVCLSVDLWIGLTNAGYSFAELLPIFLLSLCLPAAVAVRMYKQAQFANVRPAA